MLVYKKRQEAKASLRALVEHRQHVLAVHYSCESLADKPDGTSARVTSIAVRNLADGRTDSFSLHLIAERRRIAQSDIEAAWDELERAMLREFYEFVSRNLTAKWAHWNMRDTTFGFPALEHRFRVLGGSPVSIPTERTFDVSRFLVARFGSNYVEHPRLESLVRFNALTDMNFLPGAEEAAAFAERKFVRLHQSTLRKVSCITTIIDLAAAGKLKTRATWRERTGFEFAAVPQFLKDHWVVALISLLASLSGLVGVSMKDCGSTEGKSTAGQDQGGKGTQSAGGPGQAPH